MKTTVLQAYKVMLTEYPDVLKAEQVAEIFGIEKHKVYKMIESGELRGVKIGSRYNIPKLAVIELLLGKEAYSNN